VRIGVKRVPRMALRAMGLVDSMAREVAEMAYQWDAPYIVDDRRFRSAFGAAPTPAAEIVSAAAAWARATYGAPGASRAA
jgi:hypothetical protein